jgi:translocator protein
MRNTIKLTASITACNIAGIAGALATSPNTVWFNTINKPIFQPPNGVFGPVWTLLYTFMGIAIYQFWRDGFNTPERKKALRIFVLQFTLNSAWSFIFFGLQQIGWALVEMSLLWIAIIWCIRVFYQEQKTAALWMIPYLLWVSFALFLNFTLWQLNS